MGAQPRVFVTRRLPGDALKRLEAEHQVEVWPERLPPSRDDLMARAPELEGLLSLLTDPVDAELISAAPNLRAISNYAVGVDNVDVEAATARGIPVGNTPGVLTESTADLALALMLRAQA
jgi:glyoxylate reductase